MPAASLQPGPCSGHACWPPFAFQKSLVTSVKLNKGIFPLAGGDVRLPHCKPCGKNPACHPGAVVPSGTTVLYGLGPPSIPIPTTKTGDPETDAIITALAPKYCPAVKPASGISDSVGCGSVVALGAPTVLVYNGGAAIAALSALAAAAGLVAGLSGIGIGITSPGGSTVGGEGGRGTGSPGDNSVQICD